MRIQTSLFSLLTVGLTTVCTLLLLWGASWAGECQNWQSAHPEWIFCDDFENFTPLVQQGRYFEVDNDDGDFIVADNVGMNDSRAMRATWQPGEIDAGHLGLGFGKNPNPYMDKGIRANENFREIYYRMYVKMEPDFQGIPNKLSRATVFTDSSWSQAMIAHLWSDGQNPTNLLIDPVRCIDGNNTVACKGWNDFTHMTWLGAQSGITPIFDSQHNGQWHCVEGHIKLNDPGQANGIQEFWINGNPEARRSDLNFVGSYTDYGINGLFFETYWNAGSPKQQSRFFDNIVVSTKRIGCTSNDVPSPPVNLRIIP